MLELFVLCLFYPLNSTSSIAELISFREEGFVSALISRFNLVCVFFDLLMNITLDL